MKMTFDIPEHVHIRWQAALAVLEDLQEDEAAPFDMKVWAKYDTLWEKVNGCGSAACFAGYISVAPYCKPLGYPEYNRGSDADYWLLGINSDHALGDADYDASMELFHGLFSPQLEQKSRAKTLAFLEKRLKTIFKNSTGKNLVAPLTFWY
jgi:hypothetical protein